MCRARGAWAGTPAPLVVGIGLVVATVGVATGRQQQPGGTRFRTGVALVNVTATVTDARGRFVPNLRREDFVVYEDGAPQPITYFSSERVPVSLGIALDTSSSMAGVKIVAARRALDRFLYDLLDPQDEIFLYRFSDEPVLVQGWTTDRALLRRRLGGIVPSGETTMYDAVAEAVPMAQSGRHHKKALVIISDGNDTGSRTSAVEVRELIHESEVLVYAIGIDGDGSAAPFVRRRPAQPPVGIPAPPPWGGPVRKPFPPQRFPPEPLPPEPRPPSRLPISAEERVNVEALRAMTDDSGGRTEIIRGADDLDPATAGVADELSRQYVLAYPAAAAKDGRWHSIRVEIRNHDYHVRARRGFVAS